MADVLRWSQRVIDLADGDPAKGNFIIGSPLAVALATRAIARYALGRPGWRDDYRTAWPWPAAPTPCPTPGSSPTSTSCEYRLACCWPDDRAVREIEDALRIAERSGDDLALAYARMTLGLALVHRPTDAEREPRTEAAGGGQRHVPGRRILGDCTTDRRRVLGA